MAMTEEVLNRQSPLVGIVDSLASFVADLDTGTFSGSDAARLTELFARAEKLCSAGLAMAARRASECSAPERAGARSPGEWLAGISGTDLRSAQATLTTAEQMATAPELEDACRKGELSTDQAAEIADATKSDPSSTGRLIHQAKNRTLKGLKEDCRAVRHQARSRQDDQTRLAAMHRNRYFRTWIDRDGTGRGSFSMTPDRLARSGPGCVPTTRPPLTDPGGRGSGRSRIDMPWTPSWTWPRPPASGAPASHTPRLPLTTGSPIAI
jgi:hypothetical protein